MYFLSPFKLAVVESLPAYILGEEDRGLYKYRLATTIEGAIRSRASPPHTQASGACSSSVLVHPKPFTRLIHTKLGVGSYNARWPELG